jgi:hypothetical protein
VSKLRGLDQVLLQEPGAGLWVVAAVLAYLPPRVWGKAKAAAAYAGLHPVNRDWTYAVLKIPDKMGLR